MREARGGVLWLAAGGGVAQHDETNGNSASTWSPVPGSTAPTLELQPKIAENYNQQPHRRPPLGPSPG